LLNQHLNQSYSQFVRQHRLNEAATLLREAPDQSVLSIALQTGFRSQSTFYTAFRDVHGCTPGAYRKAQGSAETPE
jgi:AraC-like DNA-binding protein